MNKKDKGFTKETAMDLSEFLNKEVNVEFSGGRKVKGVLKSFDNVNNLILDDVTEYFSKEMGAATNELSRKLGLVFARGPEIAQITPGEIKTLSPLSIQ